MWLHPSAGCRWYVRDSLPALARQMWRYGYSKGLTLRLHSASLRPRQLAPPALVAALAGAVVVEGSGVAGSAVPAVIHLSWGAGLLVGLVPFLPASGPIGRCHQRPRWTTSSTRRLPRRSEGERRSSLPG